MFGSGACCVSLRPTRLLFAGVSGVSAQIETPVAGVYL